VYPSIVLDRFPVEKGMLAGDISKGSTSRATDNTGRSKYLLSDTDRDDYIDAIPPYVNSPTVSVARIQGCGQAGCMPTPVTMAEWRR